MSIINILEPKNKTTLSKELKKTYSLKNLRLNFSSYPTLDEYFEKFKWEVNVYTHKTSEWNLVECTEKAKHSLNQKLKYINDIRVIEIKPFTKLHNGLESFLLNLHQIKYIEQHTFWSWDSLYEPFNKFYFGNDYLYIQSDEQRNPNRTSSPKIFFVSYKIFDMFFNCQTKMTETKLRPHDKDDEVIQPIHRNRPKKFNKKDRAYIKNINNSL